MGRADADRRPALLARGEQERHPEQHGYLAASHRAPVRAAGGHPGGLRCGRRAGRARYRPSGGWCPLKDAQVTRRCGRVRTVSCRGGQRSQSPRLSPFRGAGSVTGQFQREVHSCARGGAAGAPAGRQGSDQHQAPAGLRVGWASTTTGRAGGRAKNRGRRRADDRRRS